MVGETKRPQHLEGIDIRRVKRPTHVGNRDSSLYLWNEGFMGYDSLLGRFGVSNQPGIRFVGELGLCGRTELRVSIHPRDEFSVCRGDLCGVTRLETSIGHLVGYPGCKFVTFTSHFFFHAIDTEDLSLRVLMDQRLPVTWTDIKRVVATRSFDEHIRIQCVCHGIVLERLPQAPHVLIECRAGEACESIGIAI